MFEARAHGPGSKSWSQAHGVLPSLLGPGPVPQLLHLRFACAEPKVQLCWVLRARWGNQGMSTELGKGLGVRCTELCEGSAPACNEFCFPSLPLETWKRFPSRTAAVQQRSCSPFFGFYYREHLLAPRGLNPACSLSAKPGCENSSLRTKSTERLAISRSLILTFCF